MCSAKRQKTMSASSASAQAVLQNLSLQPVLQEPPIIHIVMYNPGIKTTQVQTKALYDKWILGLLREDVTKAICEHNADMVAPQRCQRIFRHAGDVKSGKVDPA